MDTDHDSLLETLRLTPFLAHVPPDDLARIAGRAHRITFLGHYPLFRQGDPGHSFFIVTSGHVILYLDGDSDPSHIARICGPGDSFGEWCICAGEPCRVTARAFGTAELIAIPGDELAIQFKESPALALALIGELSARLRVLVRQIMTLKMKSAAQRLGGYLLELAPGNEGACEVHLPFEKKLLASHLGMQPETLSRVLLKLQGIGVHYHRSIDAFRIRDISELRAFCNEGGNLDQPQMEDHAADW
ncbi:MAG: Crp/Fnr family transcriptional regulator [Rhodospirillales bacterium]